MHLYWSVQVNLGSSVHLWDWLHLSYLQDGSLISYFTAALCSGKDSPFPQAPTRSIHTQRVSVSLHSSRETLLSQERGEKETKPSQSSVLKRKTPCFQGSFKDKKSSSEKKKKDICVNELVLYFTPLNFMLSGLFTNNCNAMKGKVRNKRAPRLDFHYREIMAAILNFTGAEALRHAANQPVFQRHWIWPTQPRVHLLQHQKWNAVLAAMQNRSHNWKTISISKNQICFQPTSNTSNYTVDSM